MIDSNLDFDDRWKCVEPSVRALFHAKGCSSDEIEDLTQETAYRAFKDLSSKKGDLHKWINGIARLVLIDLLKKKKKRHPSSYNQSENPSPDDAADDPESRAITASFMDAIECELTKQCAKLRMEGYKFEEIAEKLNISTSKIQRLFKKIKQD